jgi:hypothetical protein
MFIDALGLVSGSQAAGQAFGAAAVSTNSVDLGTSIPKREIGTGEPLGFGFQVSVSGTVAASLVEVISATDAALTAGIIVHAAITIPLAAALAGSLWFIPLPPGTPTQQFLGIRVTTAGGTISGRSWLTTWSLFSILAKAYAKNYAV